MPKLKKFFRRLKAKKDNSNAVEKLLETVEMLQKKSEFLEKKIEDDGISAGQKDIVGKKGNQLIHVSN